MDVLVHKRATSAKENTHLATHSFTSVAGEQVVFLLHLAGNVIEAKSLEKETVAVVKSSLIETEGKPDERLDGALKELNGLFKGFLATGSLKDAHAIVGVIGQDGTLNVSHAGTAEAYLVRGGSASQITEYSPGRPVSAFVHIASGKVEPRDTIICSTQRLLRAFTPAQLVQLAQRKGQLLSELIEALESEQEEAAVIVIEVAGGAKEPLAGLEVDSTAGRSRTQGRQGRLVKRGAGLLAMLTKLKVPEKIINIFDPIKKWCLCLWTNFRKDLKDPARKHKAHLMLIAATLALFLIIWMGFQLTRFTQRSQSRAEYQEVINQIETDIKSAQTRHLAGDLDSANTLLKNAKDAALQIMNNDAGLFRTEAYDLVDRIQAKHEEFNNIIRLTPRVFNNLAAQNQYVNAEGFINIDEGEFVVYDRQDLYRVLLNTVDQPDRLADDARIINGSNFSRYGTLVFQTTNNGIIETVAGQPTSMKTEDPAGWISGKDSETYLRFLYVLSPDNNQIYKYERLSNRYSEPAEYNVNGDLEGAIDIAIDGNIYALKEDGSIVKLLRGESQPFSIRYLPEENLAGVTRTYKVIDGNFYFLDPERGRVLVASNDGGTGESSYLRQYLLEGEKIGTLRDIYVNDDESSLYVLDEKRIYVIELDAR